MNTEALALMAERRGEFELAEIIREQRRATPARNPRTDNKRSAPVGVRLLGQRAL